MTEYIEREKAFKLIKEQKEKETGAYSRGKNKGLIIAGSIINNKEVLPAADVVTVVRCEDCAIPHNKWLGCPNLNGLIPPPDFYCAKGKRKENKHAI